VGGRGVGGTGVGGTGVGGMRVAVGTKVALGGARVGISVTGAAVGLGRPPEPAIWVSWATAVCPAERVAPAITVWAAAVWMLAWLMGVGILGKRAEQPLRARSSKNRVGVRKSLRGLLLASMRLHSIHLG
jgi:hypothetical protein